MQFLIALGLAALDVLLGLTLGQITWNIFFKDDYD